MDSSLDSLSASMVLFPGIWAAVIWMLFANFQISFVKWWHMSEWEVPILLMHPIAVVLSENTLIWVFSSFMKNFEPKNMAFSSSSFICHCFSSRSHTPLLTYPHIRSLIKPIFEASVYMTLEIGWWCKLFDTNIMLSLHHFKSRSASFDSVTQHSKLPFDFFSAYVLHLSNAP